MRRNINQLVLSALITVSSGCSVISMKNSAPTLDVPVVRKFIPLGSGEKNIISSRQVSHSLPEIHVEITPEVKREMVKFTGKNSRFIEKALSRRDPLYDELLEIIDAAGIPHDILNVALIESGFNSRARSPAGAAGIWQFMKGTAKHYGLIVSAKLDQRQDPIVSTKAAVRYFKDLYEIYGDWYLVLAAYNAGHGTIDRAIKRTSHRDFWRISRAGVLKKETSGFVPKFLAVTFLINNPEISDVSYL